MKRALFASLVLFASLAPGCSAEPKTPAAGKMTVYIGSYADIKADGIH